MFDARVEGQQKILVSSRQPFTEAARTLLPLTLQSPNMILQARYDGSDVICLTGKLAVVAALTVVERSGRGLAVELWKPHQLADGLE